MARVFSRALLLGALLMALLTPLGAALGFLDSLGMVGRFLGTPYAPLVAVLALEFAHLWAGGGLRDLWALDPLFVREVTAEAKDRGVHDATVRKWREFRGWLRATAQSIKSENRTNPQAHLEAVTAADALLRDYVDAPAGWLTVLAFRPRGDGRHLDDDDASRGEAAAALEKLRMDVRPWTLKQDAPWLADRIAERAATARLFTREPPGSGG